MDDDPLPDPVDSTVPIGAAAALYGLAPSTLRWWERQGMLPPAGREHDRRRYDEAGLRRIGVAYLCHVTGRMPLDRAGIVANGGSHRRVWKAAVEDQVARLTAELAELAAARDYLVHLLDCRDSDMATECPYLPEELIRHTPRGRFSEATLTAAAGRAWAGTPGPRDETSGMRDETIACVGCGHPLRSGGPGRRRRYCSAACRQRAYRRRSLGRDDAGA